LEIIGNDASVLRIAQNFTLQFKLHKLVGKKFFRIQIYGSFSYFSMNGYLGNPNAVWVFDKY